MDTLDITSSSASIRSYIWHQESATDRPLVVALHGGGFTSGYFNAPGYSLVDAAGRQGFSVVLMDRPGYGASRFLGQEEDILRANARVLADAIGQVWRDVADKHSGIFLIGHSIGGAIALLIAALAKDWPLVGVAVSGVGDVKPGALQSVGDDAPSGATMQLPREAMQAMFFSPGAATEETLDRLLEAGAPASMAEFVAIYTTWPAAVDQTLAAITAPTQIILAEYEVLWETGAQVADRLRAKLVAVPRSDVAIFPDVGHCIEFHPQSAAFYSRILDFARGSQ